MENINSPKLLKEVVFLRKAFEKQKIIIYKNTAKTGRIMKKKQMVLINTINKTLLNLSICNFKNVVICVWLILIFLVFKSFGCSLLKNLQFGRA